MPQVIGANAATTGAASLTLAVPIGSPPQGSLILIWCIMGTASITWSASGYTAVTATSGTSFACQLLWKVADGTDGATVTVTASASHPWCAGWAVIGSWDQSAKFDPSAPAASGQRNNSSATITAATLTTVRDGDLVIWFGGAELPSGTSADTVTQPAGFTVQGSQATSTGSATNNTVCLVATQTQSAHGAISGTGSLSVAEINAGLFIAIPAGVPVPNRPLGRYRHPARAARMVPKPPPQAAPPPPPPLAPPPLRQRGRPQPAYRRPTQVVLPVAEVFQPLPAYQPPRPRRLPLTRRRQQQVVPPAAQLPALPAPRQARRVTAARPRRLTAPVPVQQPAIPQPPPRRVRWPARRPAPVQAITPPTLPPGLAPQGIIRRALSWRPFRRPARAVPGPTTTPGFAVARSTPAVSDPRDGTASVAAAVSVATVAGAVSVATATDPRDGAASVSDPVSSANTVG